MDDAGSTYSIDDYVNLLQNRAKVRTPTKQRTDSLSLKLSIHPDDNISALFLPSDQMQSKQKQGCVKEEIQHVIVRNLQYLRRWSVLIGVAMLSSLISWKCASGNGLSVRANSSLNA